jgi:hypothetical protein
MVFNNAVSSPDNMASNEMILMNNKLDKIWMEAVMLVTGIIPESAWRD